MSIDLSQFHAAFFDESFEALESMEQALLRLSAGERDMEVVNTIFRVAHSIKGGAAMFGFDAVASLTHSLESLLDAVRARRVAVTSSVVELLLRANDMLREMLRGTQAGTPLEPQRIADMQLDLELMVAGAAAPHPGGAAQAAPDSASTKEACQSRAEQPVWRIAFAPGPNMLLRGNEPLRLLAELAGLGEIRCEADSSALPPLATMEPQCCYLTWTVRLVTDAPREAIAQVFEWAEADCQLGIEVESPSEVGTSDAIGASPVTQAGTLTAGNPAPVEAPTSVGRGESVSVRVRASKIDDLVNDVGELVITQSMLVQLAASITGAAGDRLRMGLGQLERNLRQLQDAVMRVRMVPIATVLSRLPRLVRDLSQKLGKRVELRTSGADTEIDKTLLDKLGEALLHLVRNAIDHGLERPEVRRQAGKCETGIVEIRAAQRGAEVIVEVCDDGAGIDTARVLAKARSRGLIAAEANLEGSEAIKLIFEPGFSTAETATEVSGRGVGMDVVRSNIESIGGRVAIDSAVGRGTRLSIHLPLTLAIVDAQMIRVAGETYVVPVSAIVESVRLRSGVVQRLIGCGEVLSFRGQYLPVLGLAELLGARREQIGGDRAERGLVMVVEAEGRRAGLRIDGLLGQQQVVVKSLSRNFRDVEGFSGATILGDGSVALILDVAHFISRARVRTAA